MAYTSASIDFEIAAGGVNFADVLGNALKDVSAAQGEARAMAENFSAGDPTVNLQDVMVKLSAAEKEQVLESVANNLRR